MIRFMAVCAFLAGLGLLAWAPPAVPAAAPVAGENDTQKLVYLGERGPILIELRLRIDGQSFRSQHRKLMAKVFDSLDRDGDGVLSRTEASAAPSAAALSNPLTLLGFRRTIGPQPRLIPARDGKVTRQQMAAFYRRTGLAPFQISDKAPQLAGQRGVQPEPTAEQLTDRLFKLLDTDKDGQLSRKELEAAPAVLAKLDVDEDEMITSAELMGEADGSGDYVPVFGAFRQMPPTSPFRPLHVVADGGEDQALAKALVGRYGKGGGLSKEALAVLDRDRDGKLSLAELARFGDKPADVTLTVRLGNRADEALMTVKDGPLPVGVQAKTTGEGATLQLGRTRLDLSISQQQIMSRQISIRIRDQLKTVFRTADANSKGYLEKKDLGRAGFLRDIFDAVDRNGDGKITEKEFLAYYDQVDSLRKLVDRSCVSLTVTNAGRGLFDLLDSNGDGKLSVRELRNAPLLLVKLDADRDGKLARAEIPQHHRAGLALGPSGGNDPFRRVVVINSRVRRPGVRAPVTRGPLWFQKMDRNRDGDVSRKEFLGTDEQFKQIDTDGDGLISVAEAEAYDKRQRDDKERAGR